MDYYIDLFANFMKKKNKSQIQISTGLLLSINNEYISHYMYNVFEKLTTYTCIFYNSVLNTFMYRVYYHLLTGVYIKQHVVIQESNFKFLFF